MSKKVLSIILLCCVVLLAVSAGVYVPRAKDNHLGDTKVHNITVWYTDESMAAYLNEAAIAYQEQTGVAVSLKMFSGLE